nr:hypothetical protein [Tanacetum cinerariifolium]
MAAAAGDGWGDEGGESMVGDINGCRLVLRGVGCDDGDMEDADGVWPEKYGGAGSWREEE